MKRFELRVEKRTETGKGPNRRLRANGQIPAVLYGLGEEVLLSVNNREFIKLLHNPDKLNVLLHLIGEDGFEKMAIIKDYQKDPVKGFFIHIDFLEIDMNKPVRFNIPIVLTGKAKGVKEGGVLEEHLWEVEIESLPKDLPAHIEGDISELGIHDALYVKDLTVPEGVTVLSDPELLIVNIVLPHVTTETEEESEGAVEPEVITAKKEEE